LAQVHLLQSFVSDTPPIILARQALNDDLRPYYHESPLSLALLVSSLGHLRAKHVEKQRA